MTTLSVTNCAKMAGVTARTIQNRIKNGKLSATRDESGHYKVELCEFLRLYPNATDGEKQEEEITEVREDKNIILTQNVALLEQELKSIKRENEMLLDQLNKSEAREKDLIETLKGNTRILEHQSASKRKKILGVF